MVKKTDNKFYNIEKAEALITVEKTFGKKYGENPDVDWTETLYRKSSGEYFVYGKGGKDSPYAVDENGEAVPGSRYDIWGEYNYNQARNWVHSNCPDKMNVLTEDEPDDKKSITTVTLSAKARKNLRRKSQEMGMSTSELIRRWAESLY